jgi:lysophospholipase L1-like esterase
LLPIENLTNKPKKSVTPIFSSKMASVFKTKITVHCWGDSLTEGYTWLDDRLVFTPYTDFLKEIFAPENEPKLNAKFDFSFKNYGVSGEITGQIRDRFDFSKKQGQILAEARIPTEVDQNEEHKSSKPEEKELFVFLAGTNDLGTRIKPETAFANMYAMIFDCIHVGRKVVVCSIPSTKIIDAWEGANDPLVVRRVAYNKMLKDLASEIGDQHIQFFDFHKASGVEVDDGAYIKLNPEIAADNLHMTKNGYRLLAEGIAEKLKMFLH